VTTTRVCEPGDRVTGNFRVHRKRVKLGTVIRVKGRVAFLDV